MAGRTLKIDLGLTIPAYRQICDALRALLVEGAFEPGEQLPTVRQLAIDLAVHHNTVAQAYRELAEEGWLDLVRHRGATVRNRTAPAPSSRRRQNWLQRMRELVAQGLADGLAADEVVSALSRLAAEIPKDLSHASHASQTPNGGRS